MKIALDILGGFLAFALFMSAIGKITRNPGAIEVIRHVGVKESQFNLLAAAEILGSIGLIAGIWSKPIGVAAAIGAAIYFIGAQTAHVRVKDSFKTFFPAVLLFVISAATMVLELKRK